MQILNTLTDISIMFHIVLHFVTRETVLLFRNEILLWNFSTGRECKKLLKMSPLEISFSIEYVPQCKPLKVEGHPPLFTHLSLQNLHV